MMPENDDIQAQDAGDEEPNYSAPFGVVEDKAAALGFKDRRVEKLSKFARLRHWIHRRILRPWQ